MEKSVSLWHALTIDISGLHRTNTEISKMNGLTELITGANLRYNINSLKKHFVALFGKPTF
jgi:hypothetical protein